jgi:hypothetical protein
MEYSELLRDFWTLGFCDGEIQTATQWHRSPAGGLQEVLHPRKEVCAKYPNANKGDVLNEQLVVRTDEKTVNKRQQLCVIMRHVDFDNGLLLHAVACYCKVQHEGPAEHFF